MIFAQINANSLYVGMELGNPQNKKSVMTEILYKLTNASMIVLMLDVEMEFMPHL